LGELEGEVLGPLEGGTPVMEEPLGGFSAFRTGAAVTNACGPSPASVATSSLPAASGGS